jgi:hypothetical protein
MIQFSNSAPDLMPDLSPGRHRTPRKGACFMEFASYLAGEKWSDHPKCTHPLLAAVARLVNDFTSDAGRSRLVPLIPRVIGLTSENPALNLRIVVHAASAAIPVASLERQRALAVGLISCSRLVDPADEALTRQIEDALDQVPDSERWAREFISTHRLGPEKSLLRRGSEAMIRLSLVGIAFACVPDADERMYNLLERLIVEFEAVEEQPVEPVEPVTVPAAEFARA